MTIHPQPRNKNNYNNSNDTIAIYTNNVSSSLLANTTTDAHHSAVVMKNLRCKRKRSQLAGFLLAVTCASSLSFSYLDSWMMNRSMINNGITPDGPFAAIDTTTTTALLAISDDKKESTNVTLTYDTSTILPFPPLLSTATTTVTTPSPTFSSSCQRRCYDYRNKVLILPLTMAGLLDRLFVIQTMLNVAGYLCAQLYVPRPKFLLGHRTSSSSSSHHVNNHDVGGGRYNNSVMMMMRIHPNVQWSDFFQLSNLTELSSHHQQQQQQQKVLMVDWVDDTKWFRFSPNMESSFRQKEAYQKWLFIETSHHASVWTDFLRIEEHSFATQLSLLLQQESSSSSSSWHDEESSNETAGFIWQLSARFYTAMDRLAQGMELRLRQRRRKRRQQHHTIPSAVQLWMQSQQQYTTPFMTMMNDSSSNYNSNNSNTTTMTEVETSSVDQWWRRMQPDLKLQLNGFYRTPKDNDNHHSSSLIPVSLQTTRGCTYFQMNTPHELQLLRDEIFRIVTTRQWHNYTILSNNNNNNNNISTTRTSQPSNVGAQTTLSRLPPVVGYFHLRRNDATIFCNTPLEKVESYLSCSLPEALSYLSSLMTTTSSVSEDRFVLILLSSDETDEQYRRAVLQLIERQQQQAQQKDGHHLVRVVAMDLDDIVRHVVEQGVAKGTIPSWLYNQFYLFQCNLAVRDDPRIQIRLFQRRVFCPACTNVTQQLLEHRV